MGIQLSDRVENIVGKGEIAHYEQFLLFPQCFQKLSVVDASKQVSVELKTLWDSLPEDRNRRNASNYNPQNKFFFGGGLY